MKCANCNNELERINSGKGFYYSCRACDGKMVSIPVLKREHIDPEILKQIHSKKQDSPTDFSKRCPQCNRAMKQLSITLDSQTLELEFCQQCFCLWFDKSEHESLPIKQFEEPLKPKLHPESIEAMVKADMEILNVERQLIEKKENLKTDYFLLALRIFGL